jgi:hypothetical protein
MQVDGDLDTTIKFVDSLNIPYIAPSFGGCESIVDQPAIMSYWYSLKFLIIWLHKFIVFLFGMVLLLAWLRYLRIKSNPLWWL